MTVVACAFRHAQRISRKDNRRPNVLERKQEQKQELNPLSRTGKQQGKI
jgi:hypothetical protein